MFHLIRKYSNRKLYDTYQKCFITLDEIAELVINSEDVRIEDSDTNVDITPIEVAKALLKYSNRGNPVGNILKEKLDKKQEYLEKKSINRDFDTSKESLNYIPAEIRILDKVISYIEGIKQILKMEPPYNQKLHSEMDNLFSDSYKKFYQLKKKYKL